jgi:hypothetical protein
VNRQRSNFIDGITTSNWGGLALFAGLGCFFLQKAVRRKAARTWGWGRSGEAAPLSRASYAIWGIMFLLIGGILLRGPEVEPFAVWLFALCFVALGFAGFRDVRAEDRRRRDIRPTAGRH